MGTLRRHPTGAPPIVAALVLFALALAAAPASASLVPATSSAQAARSYWTPARMRSARPLPESRRRGSEPAASAALPAETIAEPTAPGVSQNGAVFIVTESGLRGRCSGTAVEAGKVSLVVTAGHCVHDLGNWLRGRWVFVPGYRYGQRPLGTFAARWLGTTPQWLRNENENFDVGMAVGFDKHPRGAFTVNPEGSGLGKWYGDIGLALTPQFFGMKIQRYMHDYGITEDALVRVAVKNFKNGALNPNAFRRTPLSEEEVLNSTMLNYPLTQYMFCSPDEGAAAVVLCKAEHAHRYTDTPVYLRATTVRTRRLGAFEVHSPWLPIEQTPGPTVDASRQAYEMAGIGPEDVDVIQLQDTDAGAEVIHLAENGFCADGDQEALVADAELEIGGRLPVNTDGGLIANGEPIGASGLRQVHEIVLQLRGRAGDRQVPGNPKVGYTQLYGAPGTAGVSILSV